MSTLEVNTINPQSGSTITLGSSGNTVALGSGVSMSGRILNITEEVNSTRTSLSNANEYTFFSFNYNQLKANSKIRVDVVLWGEGNASGALRTILTYDGVEKQVGRTSYQYLSQPFVHKIDGHFFFDGSATTGNKAIIFKQDIVNAETGRPFVIWNPNSTDDGRMGQLSSYLTITEYDL